MLKRFALMVLLASLPLGALADDTPGSLLGPQTSAAGTGGSTTDAATLQPATIGPQQPDTSQTSGLMAPSSNDLQAPAANNDALKVLAGESDGPPHQVGEPDAGSWGLSLIAGGALLLLICGVLVVLRDRRRFLESDPLQL